MIPPGYTSVQRAYVQFRQHYGSDAAGKLGFLLCSGKLRASYFAPDMVQHFLPADWWAIEARTISVFVHGADQDIILLDADIEATLPGNDAKPFVGLSRTMREVIREDPKVTQNAAEEIARGRGAIGKREDFRKAYRAAGGSTKPGPRGPRK